jgi:two-component system cell cycle response regulator
MADEWDEEDTQNTDIEVRSPVAKRGATLTVLSGSASGLRFHVPREVIIGRSASAQVRVDDDGVSRSHARVRQDANGAMIEDLGSRNGTFVNGTRIKGAVKVSDGDKIQVGRATVLRFGLTDELDDSFHDNLVSSALRDPLTKLFNKRYLLERLDSELKFAHRHNAVLSLLVVDFDQFKQINDTHGHLAGDTVLANISGVLARAVRNEDVVARFGGDELAIVLRAIAVDSALHMAERLRRLVEATRICHDDKELRVTISIGAAGFPATKATTPDELVEAADQALYRAKHDGRNRVSR